MVSALIEQEAQTDERVATGRVIHSDDQVRSESAAEITSLIRLEGAAKHYVDETQAPPALDSIDLDINVGDFVAIMGPSGSGKTTLLGAIGGMNPVSEGKVLIDGIDVYGLSGDRQADYRSAYLGFIFQQHHLLAHLTAQENVLLSAAMNNPDGSALESAMSALERVGLLDKAHRLPGELSGGEQARVAIARALMRNPPIVLADEPTGTLDSKTGEQILSLLRRLNDEGHTIVMVTHSEEAAKYAGRIVRLSDGRIASDERTRGPVSDSIIPSDIASSRESVITRARNSFANARKTTSKLVNYAVGAALGAQALLIMYLIWEGLTGPVGH